MQNIGIAKFHFHRICVTPFFGAELIRLHLLRPGDLILYFYPCAT